jgi:hypothetical protein
LALTFSIGIGIGFGIGFGESPSFVIATTKTVFDVSTESVAFLISRIALAQCWACTK